MKTKHKLLLSIGSNFDHNRYVDMAKVLLYENFSEEITFTKSIWTLPVDIESSRFLNCLALAFTTLDLKKAESMVKNVEQLCGRMESDRDMNIVRVDIDILTFDGKILREKDFSRDYVQRLIKTLKINPLD